MTLPCFTLAGGRRLCTCSSLLLWEEVCTQLLDISSLSITYLKKGRRRTPITALWTGSFTMLVTIMSTMTSPASQVLVWSRCTTLRLSFMTISPTTLPGQGAFTDTLLIPTWARSVACDEGRECPARKNDPNWYADHQLQRFMLNNVAHRANIYRYDRDRAI